MSRRPGIHSPAVQVAAWSLLTVLLGTGTSLTWQLLRLHRYDAARAAAVATAPGTVIADRVDGEDAVRVRWRDLAGDVHEDRFAVLHPSRYRTGATFGVRYDPGARHPRAYPGDDRELTPAEDAEGMATLSGPAVAAALLPWLLRWSRARRARHARRGALRPMSADPLAGLASVPLGDLGSGPALGWQSWLRLRDAHAPEAGVWLQRVMWHPVLDTLDPGAAVLVHGRLCERPAGKGRWPTRGDRPLAVTVEARAQAALGEGGTPTPDARLGPAPLVPVPLVPVGRPRRDPPASVLLLPRKDARTHLRTRAWVTASGGDPTPRRRRSLLRLVAWSVAGAALPLWWLGGLDELPSLLGFVAAAAGLVWGLCAEEP